MFLQMICSWHVSLHQSHLNRSAEIICLKLHLPPTSHFFLLLWSHQPIYPNFLYNEMMMDIGFLHLWSKKKKWLINMCRLSQAQVTLWPWCIHLSKQFKSLNFMFVIMSFWYINQLTFKPLKTESVSIKKSANFFWAK